MRIIFILLSFIFFLIFLIYRREKESNYLKSELVIKARHLTVLAFREYFNNYLTQLDEKEVQRLLVGKVTNCFEELTEAEIKEIITTEFIKELIASRKFL